VTGRREVPFRGRKVTLTEPQYKILRYWADSTCDRGRDYTAERGPAPMLYPATELALYQRDWLRHRNRNGYAPGGHWVTDAGRAAIMLAPVGRDMPCPMPGCQACPGERCMDAEIAGWVLETVGTKRLRYGGYIDTTHDVRANVGLFERIYRDQMFMLGPALQQFRRETAIMRAQASGDRSWLRDFPYDPSMPVGFVVAT